MSREDMMNKLGLTLDNFKPKPNEDKQRIEELENAIIELAELIVEVQNNG